MCFTGPPGTGKTTVALRMADLLHRLGYLEKGHLVHAMRDDLVAEYIGQTAPETKRVLDRAMGGVLFIDEAYYLYRASDSKDYGQEVVDIRRMMKQSNYYLPAEAEAAFSEYLSHQMDQPRFANARSVRNELDRARLRHAHRLAAELDRDWNRDDLMRLEPADVVIRA
jgi:SpoVK/Ycf46/Vps4 family AAA+-type ATPase